MNCLHFVLPVLAVAAPDPQDPPFDLTKVLFSGVFSDHVVLQRDSGGGDGDGGGAAPRKASLYGTASVGGTVTVKGTNADGWEYTSPPVHVTSSADPAVHGTWKVFLPPRPAGLGYTFEASCEGCTNATSVSLSDVGFGDVWLCSGQSNMEDPVLTTVSRNTSYAAVAKGTYNHVRLFQTGWRMDRETANWILPQKPDDSQGYPQQTWQLPEGCADQRFATCSLQRFSAICWYFGKNLADIAAEQAGSPASPVPIGLIHSSIGGTTIQQWMPPSTVGNSTCTENNCGHCEQLAPSRQPAVQPAIESKCTNASTRSVWSCPSGTCSTLYNGMIAPFVNMTVAGAIWYQGEQNVEFGGGSATQKSGYACQQASMIGSWRKAFSATNGTTSPSFPFGVTSLAGGCSEGFPLWSDYQHFTKAQWETCTGGTVSQLSPMCKDMQNDWAAGLRSAQTAGFGYLPNAVLPNTFLGQAWDFGEPCNCDRHAVAPNGCWANGQCYGWDKPYSLNKTWNYQNSGIHPRVKETVGKRLARAAWGLKVMSPMATPQPTPKLSGCRLDASGVRLVLHFDHGLLGGEAVSLQPPGPGAIPLELQIGPAVPSGPGNTSGWVYAAALTEINATAIAVTLPAGASMPTGVRYAWGDYPCCPGLEKATFFCPPAACPIVSATTKEPAVPFFARIIQGGTCECDAPWNCSA